MSKVKITSVSNPVAKHCRTFNKATIERDKKQLSKRGHSKHKGRRGW